MKKYICYMAFILSVALPQLSSCAAPDFTLNSLKGGGSVSLSSLKGKVVLMDFWASWCGPCKISIPAYNQLNSRFGSQGFTVIGINQDRDSGEALKFLSHTPAQFTLLADPENKVAHLYNPPTMPTSYLIDQSGNIVKTYEGFHAGDENTMAADIEGLLAGHGKNTASKGSEKETTEEE